MTEEQEALSVLNESIQDAKWIESNRAKLQKKYNERFIAVKNEQILAVGKDFDELTNGLAGKQVSLNDVIVEFMTKIIRIL